MQVRFSYGAMCALAGCAAVTIDDPARLKTASFQVSSGSAIVVPPAVKVAIEQAVAEPLQAPGAILNRSDTFTIWERTYICVSATVDPVVWDGDYTSDTERSVAGWFTGEMARTFIALKVPDRVPGDTGGVRFSSIPDRDLRCAKTSENIFVDVKIGTNGRGGPFRISYTATQNGKSFEEAIERGFAPIERPLKDQGDTFDSITRRIGDASDTLARQLTEVLLGKSLQ